MCVTLRFFVSITPPEKPPGNAPPAQNPTSLPSTVPRTTGTTGTTGPTITRTPSLVNLSVSHTGSVGQTHRRGVGWRGGVEGGVEGWGCLPAIPGRPHAWCFTANLDFTKLGLGFISYLDKADTEGALVSAKSHRNVKGPGVSVVWSPLRNT